VTDRGLSLLDWRRRVFALYAAVRAAGRDDLFANHPQSPLSAQRRATFTGIPVAAYDPAWRFELPVDTDVEPAHIEIATGTDGIVPFERVGVVRVPDAGQLDVWALRSYGGGLFIPLRDRSAGRSTYGGGRYLIDTAKGADLGGGERRLVLDFNFAYHPSCAYDEAWACPLAPPGNVLEVDVPVGEQLPGGGWY
jgi:uncharacterized protein